MSAMIGHSDIYYGSDHREESRWIGKPWRRVEFMRHRFYYRGEECDRSWDLTAHLGLRRLGFAVTLSLSRQSVLDYSDESA